MRSHRKSGENTKRNYDGIPFDTMIGILKTYLKDEVPVVSRISENENGNPFLILVGTLLSLRTKDETTDKAMAQLTKRARTQRKFSGFLTENGKNYLPCRLLSE